MIAIIIGMWTRFIHWQNKLTIDYFSKCICNVPPICAHTNKSYRSIFPHQKMKIIHMEITSYSKHFSHQICSLFRWIKKEEAKKREKTKDEFRPSMYFDLWSEYSLICWFRPKNTYIHAHSFSHHIHKVIFLSSQWQYSREANAILLWFMASYYFIVKSLPCVQIFKRIELEIQSK